MKAQFDKPFRPRDFFATHPVFTHAEFVAAHTRSGRSENTSNSLLAKHVASGRLIRLRRGLYATIPLGVEPGLFSPDPYVIATRLREDAVVAFHSALAFHGRAYSMWQRVQYLTSSRVRLFRFRDYEFSAVQAPQVTRALPDFGGGVLTRPHAGSDVRVTSLERGLVDLLHSPEHGGGWEEIWRSLEMVEYFDLEAVLEYTRLMGSALTAARVGFFLEQHREEWMVEEKHLAELLRHAPSQPRYLDSHRKSGKLVSRWNLVVPGYVLDRRWDEMS
jgi:predicted transcriptional regulator of viral defense system